jgi:choline dehydrogenase-like flavoprotein
MLPDLELAWIGAWGTAEDPVPQIGKQGFNTLLVQLPRPESKGTITVTSRDARVPPIVDPNYLADSNDLEIIRKGVVIGMMLGRKMMEKYSMTEILVPQLLQTQETITTSETVITSETVTTSESSKTNARRRTPGSQVMLSPESLDPTTKDKIDEFIKAKVSGAYHLSSTCRMAPREENGVVDQELKVYGVEGLRVADASVFPRLVGMKPQATIVLVGQKCAELIIGGAGRK